MTLSSLGSLQAIDDTGKGLAQSFDNLNRNVSKSIFGGGSGPSLPSVEEIFEGAAPAAAPSVQPIQEAEVDEPAAGSWCVVLCCHAHIPSLCRHRSAAMCLELCRLSSFKCFGNLTTCIHGQQCHAACHSLRWWFTAESMLVDLDREAGPGFTAHKMGSRIPELAAYRAPDVSSSPSGSYAGGGREEGGERAELFKGAKAAGSDGAPRTRTAAQIRAAYGRPAASSKA